MLKLPDKLSIDFIKSLENTDVISNYSLDDRIKIAEYCENEIEDEYYVCNIIKKVMTKSELLVPEIGFSDSDVEMLFCEDSKKRAELFFNDYTYYGEIYINNDAIMYEEFCKLLLNNSNFSNKQLLNSIILGSKNYNELNNNLTNKINDFSIRDIIHILEMDVFSIYLNDIFPNITSEDKKLDVLEKYSKNHPNSINHNVIISLSQQNIMKFVDFCNTNNIELDILSISNHVQGDEYLSKLYKEYYKKFDSHHILLKIKNEELRYNLLKEYPLKYNLYI